MGSFAQELQREHLLRSSHKVDEAEFYKFYTKPPIVPPQGKVMFLRTVGSNFFKIVWADGQSLKLYMAESVYGQLEKYGIPRERAERSLSYLWNFQKCFVTLEPGSPDTPPFKVPTHPEKKTF